MTVLSVLDDALRGNGLVPAFQPIVTLGEGTIVGYEALARWPQLAGIGPSEVFTHARDRGQVHQLDQRCSTAAIRAVLDANLPAGVLVSVNYEPLSPYPGGLDRALLARARAELTLAFELTERSMLTHPSALLSTVAAMRADGFLIAIDDVGAHPDSLALLDLLEPDIVKLDMGLVQQQPRREQARTVSAVLAHHERTHVPILAEGIETADHLEHALALGASLGQGFLYGHPGPLRHEEPLTAGRSHATATKRRDEGLTSPFDVADRSALSSRVGRKQTLIALSDHIEAQAGRTADPPIVLAALQHHRHFTARTRQRYAELAHSCPLVAVFGEDLPEHVGSGVRGVALHPPDPLCAEWTVVVLGPHLAVALIARERPAADEIADLERQFDFFLTYDRTLVTAAAHSLLHRML